MQRVIVQDQMLPAWVMEMIDAQDEDDDYQHPDVAHRDTTRWPELSANTYRSWP
jgi:hypothetical protein